MFAVVAPILLALAFLLLLLVSLSVPIIKTIYIFKLAADVSSSLLKSGASGSAQFGVWGYCLSAIDVSVVGINHDSHGQCSSPHLGYSFDSTIANALHVNGIENDISRTLTAALVLHPIACGLTFLALASTAVLHFKGGVSRIATTCRVVSTTLATLLAAIIFTVSIAGVNVARDKVADHTDGDVHLTADLDDTECCDSALHRALGLVRRVMHMP
ncbi:hypothetical protein EUX98_g8232 [Antrodiella citrinella]|uniref:Uncharacterized protein n=1 Tax=Antrodiella citrinella TaxID=2447956 RepID=A0A4S4MBN5_9APHY|nr:hypothetical protein EUX98_g8232 [Antrodiella citrinella]